MPGPMFFGWGPDLFYSWGVGKHGPGQCTFARVPSRLRTDPHTFFRQEMQRAVLRIADYTNPKELVGHD